MSIKEYRFVLRSQGRYYRINSSYKGSLDDFVSVVGQSDAKYRNTNDYAQRIETVFYKVSSIRTENKKQTFRSFVFEKVRSHELLSAIIFAQYHEDYPLISSVAMSLSGVLLMLRFALRRFFSKDKIRIIQLVFLCVYGTLMGGSYALVRMILSRTKVTKENEILIMMMFFPNTIMYLGFLFPYLPILVQTFSERFSKLHPLLIYSALLSISRFRLNIFELILFRVQQVFCGCLLIISFITLKFPLDSFLERLLTYYNLILSHPFFERMSILGSLSVWPLVLVMIWFYFGFYKTAMTFYLLSFVMLMFPYTWRVTYINVGQGDATLIQSPFNAFNILIDTGKPSAYYQLKRSLDRHGVQRINALVITHDDLDHSGNVHRLLDRSDELIDTKHQKVDFLQMYLEDRTYESDNENSLIFSFATTRSTFLFMGDAGRVAERDFIKDYPTLQFTYLKLGHHGSRTSTSREFLTHVKPVLGLISSKPSTYNHPHPEVLKLLAQFQVIDLQTHNLGDIQIVSGILFDYLITEESGFGIIR